MKKKKQLLLIVAIGLLAGPIAAQADFNFELVDHPGAPDTQVFGINDRGDVVGNGNTNVATLPFVFASKKGTLTDVTPVAGFDDTSVLGISDNGVLVGSVTNFDPDPSLDEASGLIIDQNGASTLFDHPDALLFTQARGVNDKGLVTGFRDRPFPLFNTTTIVAFVYDSKRNTFTDIIPESDHVQSIAQGINSKGEVVGSAFFLDADDPCGDSGPFGFVRKGWHRATDGTVTYFTVNGSPRTAARGINDLGTIVGFFRDPNDGKNKGFKVELDGSQCQEITVASGDLLDISAFDDLFAQGITNSGVIVGQVNDANVHGFIARPE